MGLTIGTIPNINLDDFTFPEPISGYEAVASWQDPSLQSLSPDTTVYSLELDIAVPDWLSPDTLSSMLSQVQGALSPFGLSMLAWQVDGGPVNDVTLPDQICVPGTDWCVTPPGAGTTVATMVGYRVWMLVSQSAAGLAYRGQWQGFGLAAALAVVVSIALVLAGVIALIGMANGSLSAKDFLSWLGKQSPGSQLQQPIIGSAIPLAILGLMIGGGIVLISRAPHGSGSLNAQVKVPHSGVTVGGNLEGRR